MFFKRRVIICANQISLTIAVNLASKDKLGIKTIVFYDSSRCDADVFDMLELELIKYSRWTFLFYIINNYFIPPFEICVPHFKGGRLIRIYAKYAKKISAIDDGLDTFREYPRNIDPSDFKLNANYYTFNYDVNLAAWLGNFNLVNVCELEDIARSRKKTLNLNDFDVILVESPGIESVDLQILKSSRVLLVKHSNPNKNISAFKCYQFIIGSEFALENSIKGYQGTLVIGESMTAVYALQLRSPTFNLLVAVNDGNKRNLTSFVELVNNKEFAKLLVIKN